MPAIRTKHYTVELQRQLRCVPGHEQIVTQAYGRHLLLKHRRADAPEALLAR